MCSYFNFIQIEVFTSTYPIVVSKTDLKVIISFVLHVIFILILNHPLISLFVEFLVKLF